MALEPQQPWSWIPPEWNVPIDDPYAVPLQVTTPEYGLGPVAIPPPPPPPPPPPEKKIGPVLSGPTVAEEIARGPQDEGLLTPPLIAEPTPAQTPPLLGEVDAVSGVDQKPPDEAFTGTAPIPTERPEEELTDGQLGQRYAGLSPEEQVGIRLKVEGAKENFKATQMLEASERDRQRAEQNLQDRADAMKEAQARTAKLDAEAREIAFQDPADNIPVWKKMLGVVAAVISGLDKSGRGNVGLQVLDGLVEQAAQQQRLKLEVIGKQRASVGQEVASAADLYDAQEKTRIVAWNHIIGTAEANVQQFDPRGTTAVRMMDAIGQMKAKRAEALAKYQTEQQKAMLAAFKEQREVAQLQEQQRHNKAQEKVAATGAYASLISAKTGAKKAAQDYDIDKKKLQLEADKLRAAGDQKAAELLLERGIAAPPESTIDEQGNLVVKPDTGALKQADGKTPWIPPTKEEAVEFRKKKAAADNLMTNLDELRKIRDRVGGESSVWNSDDYQRLKVIRENLVLLKKSGTQGMSSDADMDRIIASMGAKDPASFRAQMAGLDEGRRQIENQLNTDAKNLGYNGKPITYTDPLKLKGGATVEAAAAERVLSFDPSRDDGGKWVAELGLVDQPAYQTATSAKKAQMQAEALTKAGGIPPSVKKTIDDLQASIDNPKATPKARETARALMDKIAAESESPAVRSYAKPYANANAVQMPQPAEEQLAPEID